MRVIEVTSVYYHVQLNLLPKDLRKFISKQVDADKFYLVFDNTGLPAGGFGTTSQGWLLGLFSLKKQLGDSILDLGIEQLKIDSQEDVMKLFCTGEFLRKMYFKKGFDVYSIVEWDKREAPKDWNYKKYGSPPLYFMRKTKD